MGEESQQKGNKFNYTFFPEKEIDKQFNNIILACKGINDHVEINKIIHKEFYNQLFITTEIKNHNKPFKLYRVTIPYQDIDCFSPSAFSHPPKKIALINRANVKNHPVFYGSLSPAGALREMKELLGPGKEFFVSEWEIDTSIPFLSHSLCINSKTIEANSLIHKLSSNHLNKATEMLKKGPVPARKGLIRYLQRVGDLFALPGNEYYNITSAYAHSVLYEMRKKGAVVQMIMYPSVISEEGLLNFALHPDMITNNQLKLNRVFKLVIDKLEESSISVKSSERGINIDGKISWSKPSLKIEKIDYSKLELLTHDKSLFKGEDALNKKINNTEKTVEILIKEEVENHLYTFLSNIPYDGNLFSFEPTDRSHSFILKFNHGLEIPTNKDHGCIDTISVPVFWKEHYVPLE